MSSTPEKTMPAQADNATIPRPPIVAVVGHVDHGKTTLLDYIRKTKVADREAGGITQKVGAYEIVYPNNAPPQNSGDTNAHTRMGNRITFIDTPGHEAFTKMRQRGARIADLAILVVAADDGVKPQTKEAIEILQAEKTPFVVAINKIDKNNADPERAKQDLLKHNVYLEKYGGDVSWVEISAKEGTGIDELLDHILLMWEVDKPVFSPQGQAKGFILESERDSRKGIVASVIVRDGVLKEGDPIATETACGKIRMLQNFLGERVTEARPSSPAIILGFEVLPQAGESFIAGATVPEADLMPKPEVRPDVPLPVEGEQAENVIKIVLKADVSGSLEALEQVILNTPIEGKSIRILSREVGDINDNDVKNAESFGAHIVGFNVKPSKSVEQYAKAKGIRLIVSNIIYRLVEELQEMAKHAGETVELGRLEVLATFSQKNRKQVIGGKIEAGYFTLHERFSIMRNNEKVGTGKIVNLQKGKNDVKKVDEGECGMFVETSVPVEKGDFIVVEEKA